ncbi:MAG: hypothetical protein RIF33_19720 [Cyclobacteriaceae bacterium]
MIWKFSYQNGEQYYNRLHLYFNGLVAITLFPFAIVYLELDRGTAKARVLGETISTVLSYIVPIVAGALMVYAFKTFRKSLASAPELLTLRSKLDLYYQSALKKYLVLGAAALITILCFYGTQASIFIVVYVFVLIAFSLGRPTIKIIGEDCKLGKEEMKILQDKLPIE